MIFSSFVFKDKTHFIFSVSLMFISFLLSITASFLFNLEVIPAIINTGFFIFVMGWTWELTHRMGGILTTFIMGCLLFGFALLVESHPEYFVTSLF